MCCFRFQKTSQQIDTGRLNILQKFRGKGDDITVTDTGVWQGVYIVQTHGIQQKKTIFRNTDNSIFIKTYKIIGDCKNNFQLRMKMKGLLFCMFCNFVFHTKIIREIFFKFYASVFHSSLATSVLVFCLIDP